MSFAVKRSSLIGGKRHSLGLSDRPDAESLFEREWDELVIRFDEERQGYRVGTASQAVEQDNERHPAKSPDK